MLTQQATFPKVEGVHTEVNPMAKRQQDTSMPTWDEQFYRIGGTTTGGAFLGGALSVAAGSGMLIGASLGALVGLGIAGAAAYRTLWSNAETWIGQRSH